MSKGSARRPTEVPTEVADANWDNIFGKKNKPEVKGVVDQAEKDLTCDQSASSTDAVNADK